MIDNNTRKTYNNKRITALRPDVRVQKKNAIIDKGR